MFATMSQRVYYSPPGVDCEKLLERFLLSKTCYHVFKKLPLKGTGRSADLKINKSAPLSLNHHTFSNTEPIYTK